MTISQPTYYTTPRQKNYVIVTDENYTINPRDEIIHVKALIQDVAIIYSTFTETFKEIKLIVEGPFRCLIQNVSLETQASLISGFYELAIINNTTLQVINPCPLFVSNDDASGFAICGTVDENTNGFGNAMHIDTDGNYIDAQADDAGTMPCQAIALEVGTGSKILLIGPAKIKKESWTWTVGGAIYVSESSSGRFTQTKPGVGNKVQKVGFAMTAREMFFNPNSIVIGR